MRERAVLGHLQERFPQSRHSPARAHHVREQQRPRRIGFIRDADSRCDTSRRRRPHDLVVRVGAALASLGALLALIASVARTSLAMARNHDLPVWLAAVHPHYRVPHRAEVTLAAVVSALVLTTDVRAFSLALRGPALLRRCPDPPTAPDSPGPIDTQLTEVAGPARGVG